LLLASLPHAARACKADADKHCNVSTYNGFRNGTIIGCLRDIREKLTGKCAKEIFRWVGG
jgi:Golgi apparatus protein 1